MEEKQKGDFKGAGVHRVSTDFEDTVSKTVDAIEKSQLENSANNVDMRKASVDPILPIYGKEPIDDPTVGTKSESSEMSKHYIETSRFAKSHSVITTKENALRDVLKMKSDNPSD